MYVCMDKCMMEHGILFLLMCIFGYVGSAYALRWGAGTNVGGRREEESTGLHRKRIRCREPRARIFELRTR